MSIRPRRLSRAGEGAQCRFAVRRRGASIAATKLGASHSLIAPAHTLTLPSMEGVKDRLFVSLGSDLALGPATAMVKRGLLDRRHLAGSGSVPQVLERALSEFLEKATGEPWVDKFEIELTLSDGPVSYSGELYRSGRRSRQADFLVLTWTNTSETQYIPLRPIFDQLQGNPQRERLMASLYQWLYQGSWHVFYGFGLDEAEEAYLWRKEAYLSSREEGEDVDLEGEVEFADPASVIAYIRQAKEMILEGEEVGPALASINDARLRRGFERAHELFLLSESWKLPMMSEECAASLEQDCRSMEGAQIPGLCVSHWRDDAIVAWLDETLNEAYQNGMDSRSEIMFCFESTDHRRFLQFLDTLPTMAKIVQGLSEWVGLAEEMESACHYGDRR